MRDLVVEGLPRMGRNPDAQPAVATQQAQGSPHQLPTASPNPRKLRLSSVLDPTLDAEIQLLTPSGLHHLYDTYKVKFGDYLGGDVDPSADQVSALDIPGSSGGIERPAVGRRHGLRPTRAQAPAQSDVHVVGTQRGHA